MRRVPGRIVPTKVGVTALYLGWWENYAFDTKLRTPFHWAAFSLDDCMYPVAGKSTIHCCPVPWQVLPRVDWVRCGAWWGCCCLETFGPTLLHLAAIEAWIGRARAWHEKWG